MSRSQWSLLIFLSVIWGGSFLFVAFAVRELPPLTIVFARVIIAALILVPVTVIMGHALPTGAGRWRDYAVMATLNNVLPFTLIVWGQQFITTGLASVLNATVPLWAVLLAHWFATERLTTNRIGGVLIGIGGVVVLVGPEALDGNRSGVLGMTAMLGATLCYALSSVWARRFKGVHPLVSASTQLTCSSALLLPLAFAFDQPWSLGMPSTAAIVSLVGLGVLSTALAYVILFHIMTVSGPSNAMLVTLLIPVSAVLLGHMALAEPLLARHIAGGAVIGVALLVIDGRVIAWIRGLRTST